MKLIEVSEVSSFERYKERFGFTAPDAEWLIGLSSGLKSYGRDSVIARQNYKDSNIHILQRGWAYSAIEHVDGSRTVLDIHLPGDFIVSPGILSTPRRSSLVSLSDCTVAELDINDVTAHSRRSASVGDFLLHILGQHHEAAANRVVQSTRMPAITRLAVFYLDMLSRIQEVSSGVSDQFYLPATSALIAEALGMTAVHSSRTHSRLRELGALTVEQRVVHIRNFGMLTELSNMDSDHRQVA